MSLFTCVLHFSIKYLLMEVAQKMHWMKTKMKQYNKQTTTTKRQKEDTLRLTSPLMSSLVSFPHSLHGWRYRRWRFAEISASPSSWRQVKHHVVMVLYGVVEGFCAWIGTLPWQKSEMVISRNTDGTYTLSSDSHEYTLSQKGKFSPLSIYQYLLLRTPGVVLGHSHWQMSQTKAEQYLSKSIQLSTN